MALDSYNGYTGIERQMKFDAYKLLRDRNEDPYSGISNCQLCLCPEKPLQPHSEDYSKPYRWGAPWEYVVCASCHSWIHKRFSQPANWLAFRHHVRRGGWGHEFASPPVRLEREAFRNDPTWIWPTISSNGANRPIRSGLDWWESLTICEESKSAQSSRIRP